MSFIVEAALSPFFEALISKTASLISSNFKLVCNKQVCKEIEKWREHLEMIDAVLADAEGKQMQKKAVKIWLANLRDVAYDVDDILDEFATKALERKLMEENHDQASTSKISKRLTFGSNFHPSTIMMNYQLESKVAKITERLKRLAAQKSEFQLTDHNCVKGVIPKPIESSLMDESAIYGRQKDKEEILRLLLSNDDIVSVIPIVGMGGIGKTTLAQLVYNDDSIKDHFDPKAWVCVSEEFDVVNVTKKILSEVSSESHVDNDLNPLQIKLKERLSGKRFFLVLDDVWNQNYNIWDMLRRPFAEGAPGSKVIVTTRNSEVSSFMRTVGDHLLQKLSDDDALRILAHHALGAGDFSDHPELEVIGREILKKCDGLPLATKTIGGLLRNNFNLDDWKRIKVSQFWNSAEDESQIMPALRLSYYHLPSRLKQCFACCSLIPKDYEFEEEEIIPVWMAEGFLHQANTTISSEDLGRQYFKELASRSFFQASKEKKSKFIMHDLINDLAQSVAQEFYFPMEEQQKVKISRRTRHLSYTAGLYDRFEKFENVYEAKRLRTFHSFVNPGYVDFYLGHNVIIDVMSKLRYLRVISLKRYKMCEIPDSIGNLKHLRFLDFSYTMIKCLPDSVCNLYNLMTLKLRGCQDIVQLPLEMGNLVNLCHLDIFGACSIQKLPSGIGKLTNLQVLSNFIVGQGEAANIREMQDLSGLKGKLSISGLQNVNDARDASVAKMSNKSGLSDLKLEWSDNFDENLRKKEVEGDVLRFLQPHKELKVLTISYYAGETFPSWIKNLLFKNLQSLTLEGCRNCKSLPAVGKLPLLKDLCIKGMNGVTSVGNEFYGENLTNPFPSLESLHFVDMAEWKEWKACEVDEQGKIFHCLRELHIRNCPKLLESSFVNGFRSLEKLQIYKCEELQVSISTLPKVRVLKIDECKEVVFGSYSDVCSVREVFLSYISKLAFESKETVMPESMKVESLNVNASWWPTKWEWLASLESLSYLKIDGFPKVVSVGTTKIEEEENQGLLELNVPCNIGRMRIEYCKGFESISDSFQNLRCLTELEIIHCGKLVSIETNSLPPTLKHLVIRSCENVQCLLDDREDMNFSSTSLLESLKVEGCIALKWLSSSRKLPTCLKSLEIDTCQNVQCLLDDREDTNFSSTSLLQSLRVFKCKALKWLSSSGKLPTGLKSFSIIGCSELEFVVREIRDEARLESIDIFWCKKIKYLPQGLDKLSSLQHISICRCPELECLPESGLPPYTNLKYMQILECPRLKSMFSEGSFGLPTNLTDLEVDGPDMIKALMEGGLELDRLTSLEKLSIHGDSISFAQEKDELEMKLPTSLTSLSIKEFKYIRKISSNTVQNLTSLLIYNCPRLNSLPKKEMLPSLLSLSISCCPELSKMCEKDEGKVWSNIAHIPKVETDFKSIYG